MTKTTKRFQHTSRKPVGNRRDCEEVGKEWLFPLNFILRVCELRFENIVRDLFTEEEGDVVRSSRNRMNDHSELIHNCIKTCNDAVAGLEKFKGSFNKVGESHKVLCNLSLTLS